MTDLEALAIAMDECSKPAPRECDTVGARTCFEIRDAIFALFHARLKAAQDQTARKRIHEEIADDLDAQSFCGAMEWSAYGVVKTIAAGRIRHLTINY